MFLSLSTSTFPVLIKNEFFRPSYHSYAKQELTMLMPMNTALFGDIDTVLWKAAEIVGMFDPIWAEKDNPQTQTAMEVHQNLMEQIAKLQALQEQMEIFLPRTERENIDGFSKTWMDVEMRITKYFHDDFQGRRKQMPLRNRSGWEMDERANQKKQAKAVISRHIVQIRLDLMQFAYEMENLQIFSGNCGDDDAKEQHRRKVVFLNRMSEEHRFLIQKVEWMTKWLDVKLGGSASILDDFDPDLALSLAYTLKSYLDEAHRDHLERIYGAMGLYEIAVEPDEMIGCLPLEILLEIFGNLDGASHHRLRRICSSWDGLLIDPLLRKHAFLELKLSRNIFYRFESVKSRAVSAFEQCLENRTTHLILKVDFTKDQYDGQVEGFTEDWLLGPIIKQEHFQKAERLQCIILHDFAVQLGLDMLAASLPDSLEKVIFRNVCLLARVEGSGLFRHTSLETHLDMHVVEKGCKWPWGFCIGFDAVQFVGGIMGPLSDGQRAQFAGTVFGRYSRLRQPLMTEYRGYTPYNRPYTTNRLSRMQKSADGGQLLKGYGDGKDPSVVGQFEPWIQQLGFAYMMRYLNDQHRPVERNDSPDNDVEEYVGYDDNDERHGWNDEPDYIDDDYDEWRHD